MLTPASHFAQPSHTSSCARDAFEKSSVLLEFGRVPGECALKIYRFVRFIVFRDREQSALSVCIAAISTPIPKVFITRFKL